MTEEATLEQRQAVLQAELVRLEQEKRDQAERERRERAAARQEQLDPALAAQANEIEKRAEEALEREFPPAWRPHKEGSGDPDTLVGMVTRIDPSIGPSPQFGTYSAAMEMVTTTGETWTVWAEHRGVIFQSMARLKIQPGELIAIRYMGKKTSEASGFTYNNFRLVRVDDDGEGAEPVDYSQIATGGDQPALPAASSSAAPDDDIPFDRTLGPYGL